MTKKEIREAKNSYDKEIKKQNKESKKIKGDLSKYINPIKKEENVAFIKQAFDSSILAIPCNKKTAEKIIKNSFKGKAKDVS